MTDTIPNVPRDLLERVKSLCEYWFVRGQQQHMSESEYKTWHALGFGSSAFTELRALLSAPSPAGVDGLAVSNSGWFSLVMNAAAELETASYSITDPDAKRVAQSGADYYRSKAESAQVVCLSDAQAIIDGLRGEVGAQRVKTCAALKERNDAREERDQHAQRIGELEGLLRHAQKQVPKGSGLHMRIDAALSAVCAAAPNIATTSEHSSQPERDPCPMCIKGGICNTPTCGRLRAMPKAY